MSAAAAAKAAAARDDGKMEELREKKSGRENRMFEGRFSGKGEVKLSREKRTKT